MPSFGTLGQLFKFPHHAVDWRTEVSLAQSAQTPNSAPGFSIRFAYACIADIINNVRIKFKIQLFRKLL